jgi:hypothetical protein
MYEYRIRWKRKGLKSRLKIYQNIGNAEKFIETLKGNYYRDDPNYDGENGIDYYEKVPELENDPVIEKRSVGTWSRYR